MNIWMVRAGRGGSVVQSFRDHDVVAIGWKDLGDLSTHASKDAIRKAYDRTYGGASPGEARNSIAVIHKFRAVVKTGRHGDLVRPRHTAVSRWPDFL